MAPSKKLPLSHCRVSSSAAKRGSGPQRGAPPAPAEMQSEKMQFIQQCFDKGMTDDQAGDVKWPKPMLGDKGHLRGSPPPRLSVGLLSWTDGAEQSDMRLKMGAVLAWC